MFKTLRIFHYQLFFSYLFSFFNFSRKSLNTRQVHQNFSSKLVGQSRERGKLSSRSRTWERENPHQHTQSFFGGKIERIFMLFFTPFSLALITLFSLSRSFNEKMLIVAWFSLYHSTESRSLCTIFDVFLFYRLKNSRPWRKGKISPFTRAIISRGGRERGWEEWGEKNANEREQGSFNSTMKLSLARTSRTDQEKLSHNIESSFESQLFTHQTHFAFSW